MTIAMAKNKKNRFRGLGVWCWGPDAGLHAVVRAGLIEQVRLEQDSGSEGEIPVGI